MLILNMRQLCVLSSWAMEGGLTKTASLAGCEEAFGDGGRVSCSRHPSSRSGVNETGCWCRSRLVLTRSDNRRAGDKGEEEGDQREQEKHDVHLDFGSCWDM
jgi:hypothetical protein